MDLWNRYLESGGIVHRVPPGQGPDDSEDSTDTPILVKVGAIPYRVHFDTDKTNSQAGKHGMGEVLGITENITSEIFVRADLSRAQVRSTLLHEVLHACWWVAGLGHIENEEQLTEESVVKLLAPVLLSVLRETPWLTDVLKEET